MKQRKGFVSNSSSSSFIINSNEYSENVTDFTVEEVDSLLVELLDFYNRFFDTNLDPNDTFMVYEHKGNPHEGWEDYYQDLKETSEKKRIFIDSIGDNTIPYTLFDWIEEKFNCSRLHLG